MGIAGIKDLYANKLSHKTKNGKAKGELISSDQFFKEIKEKQEREKCGHIINIAKDVKNSER